MKLIKNIISLALCAALIITSCISGFAYSSGNDFILDLTALGIVRGDESGNLNEDAPLTRAEFAALVVRMRNMENIISSAPDAGFEDVSDDHWAKKYIDLLCFDGTVSGVGNNRFDPEGHLTWEAAAKILVNILGYGNIALDKGGYPAGYVAQASRIGLLDNTDITSVPLPRKEAFMMIYNALDIDLMEKMYGSEEQYEIQRGNTLRSELLSSLETQKLTGVVTASIDTWLWDPVPGISDTELQIDGVTYRIGDPSLKRYLGYEVDFYAIGKNARTLSVSGIAPSDRNRVFNITPSTLDYADNEKIFWFENIGDTKTQSIKWNDDTIVIKNNQPLDKFDCSVLNDMETGNITVIDNDADKVAEVVIVKSSTDVIVDEVSVGGKILFKDGYTLYGKSYFDINDDGDDAYITLTDADMNNVSPDSIKAGDVISGFENETNHRYELILGKESVIGQITEVSDSGITIDSVYHSATSGVLSSDACTPGTYVKAYINFEGQIIALTKEITEKNYAYIVAVAQNSGLAKPVAKALLPDTLDERQEEKENENGGESDIINKLFAKNKAVTKFTISPKVVVDGKKTDGTINALKDAIEGKIVIYSLNSDNEISRIEFPKEVDTSATGDGSINVSGDKTYNSYERTFGKTSNGAFGVNEKTFTICVPKNDSNPSTYDLMVGVEMYDGREYTIKAFDKNDDTYTAGLIVIQAEMKAGNDGIINSSSQIGLVVENALALDDDDNEINKITVLSDGKRTTLTVSSLLANTDKFKDIKAGELIYYSVDLEGRMDAYKSISQGEALSKTTPEGMIGGYTESETFCGYLTDATFNVVSNNLNRWIHELSFSDEPGGKVARELNVFKYDLPDIILWNCRHETGEFIDIREINFNTDKVFMSISNSTVNSIVVIR